MVTTGQIAAFGVASIILIVIPGPSVLFVIGRALAYGRRTAIASVVGNALGVYAVAAAVALGVGTVVERSVVVFTVVKLAGACYLVWLGWQAIRHRRDLAVVERSGEEFGPRDDRRAIREGFVVGIANPKAVILFAAILPQFVNRPAGHVPMQMLLLSLVSFAVALVSDSVWGITASAVRSWFARSPRRLELVGGTGGLAMIGLGVTVAFSGRRD
jgi:threonine/homoserine/homoserine lactone efflux protein